MASILEMCVEYLKLVNEALPQEFQNQVLKLNYAWNLFENFSCLLDQDLKI